jgi:hypothetical protein
MPDKCLIMHKRKMELEFQNVPDSAIYVPTLTGKNGQFGRRKIKNR